MFNDKIDSKKYITSRNLETIRLKGYGVVQGIIPSKADEAQQLSWG